LASLPVGFLVAAILHANNLRDLDIDRQVGKRTLATMFGRTGARIEYYVLVGGTYLSLLLVVLLGYAPWLTMISLVTLPLAFKLMRIAATETEPRELQPVLRQTARLHLQFGVLLVAGWITAIVIGMRG
jgi:1,4-dihydroxy-2-naphthoate octaprenyltransferase